MIYSTNPFSTKRGTSPSNARVTNLLGSAVPPSHVTSLLTVWRRLHVEVDSMSAVVSNFVTGNITTILGSSTTLATQIVADTFVGDISGYLDSSVLQSNGRFENGSVVMPGTFGNVVTTDILGNGSDFFRIKINRSFNIPCFLFKGGAPAASRQIWMFTNALPNPWLRVAPTIVPNAFDGGVILAGGRAYTVITNSADTVVLSDADAKFPFTAFDDDDNTLLPRFPDTSDLERAFAPAYVKAFFDLPNPTPLVPFVANMPSTIPDSTAFKKVYGFDNKATEADPNFWTVYLLGAFQDKAALDADPDLIEDAVYARVDDLQGQGAAIFFEVFRDQPPPPFDVERYTVTHEIGHLFNGQHGDGGIMSSNVTSLDFSPITINKIRTIPHP